MSPGDTRVRKDPDFVFVHHSCFVRHGTMQLRRGEESEEGAKCQDSKTYLLEDQEIDRLARRSPRKPQVLDAIGKRGSTGDRQLTV